MGFAGLVGKYDQLEVVVMLPLAVVVALLYAPKTLADVRIENTRVMNDFMVELLRFPIQS